MAYKQATCLDSCKSQISSLIFLAADQVHYASLDSCNDKIKDQSCCWGVQAHIPRLAEWYSNKKSVPRSTAFAFRQAQASRSGLLFEPFILLYSVQDVTWQSAKWQRFYLLIMQYFLEGGLKCAGISFSLKELSSIILPVISHFSPINRLQRMFYQVDQIVWQRWNLSHVTC